MTLANVCPICGYEVYGSLTIHKECELKFRAACARGEHDLCYQDGGPCCTCGARRSPAPP